MSIRSVKLLIELVPKYKSVDNSSVDKEDEVGNLILSNIKVEPKQRPPLPFSQKFKKKEERVLPKVYWAPQISIN